MPPRSSLRLSRMGSVLALCALSFAPSPSPAAKPIFSIMERPLDFLVGIRSLGARAAQGSSSSPSSLSGAAEAPGIKDRESAASRAAFSSAASSCLDLGRPRISASRRRRWRRCSDVSGTAVVGSASRKAMDM
ncbi:hypothetical protein BJ166DRAFT_541636 [Pestalotiopsis sp. NC0098]|nr:hypothetical protein BJ166DRAFT_541636 [Pestalotiopsis sp. NC0098]